MKAAPVADAVRTHARRNAAVVVADPRLAVVESASAVDPEAVAAALALLVKWAVLASMGERPTGPRAETLPDHPGSVAEN